MASEVEHYTRHIRRELTEVRKELSSVAKGMDKGNRQDDRRGGELLQAVVNSGAAVHSANEARAQEAGALMNALDRLGSEVSAGLDQANVTLGRVALSVEVNLPMLVQQASSSHAVLSGISDAIHNPTATAGDEYRRRGVLALENKWLPEADREFRTSIEHYPYDARSYFALGCVLAQAGSNEEAASSFANCARYGAADRQPLAATAAVVAAGLFDKCGLGSRALETLVAAHSALAACPELEFAMFLRTAEAVYLRSALALDPSLVLDARLSGIEGVEQAAQEILDLQPGLRVRYNSAALHLNALNREIVTRGGIASEAFPQLPAEAPASAQLALMGEARASLSGHLQQISSWLKSYSAEQQTNAIRRAASDHAEAAAPVPSPPALPVPPSASYGWATIRYRASLAVLLASGLITAFILLAMGDSNAADHGGAVAIGSICLALFVLSGWSAFSSHYDFRQEVRTARSARDAFEKMSRDVTQRSSDLAALTRRRNEAAASTAAVAREVADDLRHLNDKLLKPVPGLVSALDWPILRTLTG